MSSKIAAGVDHQIHVIDIYATYINTPPRTVASGSVGPRGREKVRAHSYSFQFESAFPILNGRWFAVQKAQRSISGTQDDRRTAAAISKRVRNSPMDMYRRLA